MRILQYSAGEKVPIEFEVKVKVELGKYSVGPMLVASINDECLLGVDFLRIVNLENVFESAFIFPEINAEKNLSCSRIEDSSEKVLLILKELFMSNSRNLVESQKEVFANFLNQFQDVFSENIITGKCVCV